MHELYELKEKLMEELEEYSGKELSAGSLEVVDKLTHTIKNLCKIMEAEEDDGYSSRGGSYQGGRGGQGGSYEGGSYARGGRGQRRNSRGQYSRNARGGSYEGYSRDEDMVAELKELMQEAPDDQTRMEFQKFIRKIENR